MITGLNEKEIPLLEKKYGKNIISKLPKKSFFKRIITALSEPMVKVLVFAIFLTIIINILKTYEGDHSDWPETFGITLSVLLATAITVFMEQRSQNSFELLKDMGEQVNVKVIRDSEIKEVPQEDIYPGDIVILNIGDKIPADGQVLESFNLEIDESILTGESFPNKKDSHIKNHVFSGTYVIDGSGKFIVTSTGDKTELGKISNAVQKDYELLTPLQKELGILGKKIAIVGIAVAVIVFFLKIFNYYVHNQISIENIVEALTLSIVLIVSTIPEGLSTMIATTLALSMIKLSKENALVKKLASCESIGAIDVICSDKTGTITENKMKVIFENLLDEKWTFYNIKLNNTSLYKIENNHGTYIGNPTEVALLNYVKNIDYFKSSSSSIIYQYPFNSEKKMMGTIAEIDGNTIYFLKGAPEKILELINFPTKQIIEENIMHCQKEAQRVIAFAHKILDKKYDWEKSEKYLNKNLIFDGFMAISDPIRKDVFDAMKTCRSAGIDVKILTGDNILTARSIANQLNLISEDSLVLEASDIDNMDDEKLEYKLEKISVIARSTPMTKLRIIDLLMKNGKSVAVTGDGVNDAPSLKRAEVGISMGIAGTEVAKETSDIILLNDSFATIITAIKEGRGLYENFQKFIQFQQTVNIGALFLILIFELFGWETPLRPIQILWINIMMDGPLAISLGFEKTRENIMKDKPRDKKKNILTPSIWINTLSNALFIVCFSIFMIRFLNVPTNLVPTYIFNFFTFMIIFYVFSCKELGQESILKRAFDNKNLNIAFISMFIIQFIINLIFSRFFSVFRLSITEYLEIILYSKSILIFTEIVRWIRRKLK